MTALITAPATTPTATSSPSAVAAEVKHMAGMLWYEMLSDMNSTGFSGDALGTGGDDFQSMFMWNLAQNDFSKYDAPLTGAALSQLGGGTSPASAATAALGASGAAGGIAAAAAMPSLPAGMPAAASIAALLASANAAAAAQGAAAPAAAAPAADASATPAATGPVLDRAVAYAQKLWPQVTAAAQTLGVSPVAILAQSALETGWGAAAAGNNYFGIKAAQGQPGTARPTHEVVGGVLLPQTASFRDYDSPAASVADYVGVIQSGFQSAIGQNSVAGFAQSLQANGYATDQSYAAKIVGIAQSPLMQQVLAALPGQSSGAASE
jgi:flagellar protein FlgJ